MPNRMNSTQRKNKDIFFLLAKKLRCQDVLTAQFYW